MVVGDSNGRPVAVPVVLILALVERVQRMASSSSSSAVKGHGPQVGKRGDVARERQTEKHTYMWKETGISVEVQERLLNRPCEQGSCYCCSSRNCSHCACPQRERSACRSRSSEPYNFEVRMKHAAGISCAYANVRGEVVAIVFSSDKMNAS